MTTQFKESAEYRHWMTCFDIGGFGEAERRDLRLIIKDALPPPERAQWDQVCRDYDALEYPGWFVEETTEY